MFDEFKQRMLLKQQNILKCNKFDSNIESWFALMQGYETGSCL
jgi:hypothetical protein